MNENISPVMKGFAATAATILVIAFSFLVEAPWANAALLALLILSLTAYGKLLGDIEEMGRFEVALTFIAALIIVSDQALFYGAHRFWLIVTVTFGAFLAQKSVAVFRAERSAKTGKGE